MPPVAASWTAKPPLLGPSSHPPPPGPRPPPLRRWWTRPRMQNWPAPLGRWGVMEKEVRQRLLGWRIRGFHTRAKWAILNDHSSYAPFEWRYFGPCVCKFASRCVIWIAQFKLTVRRCFQWRISQNSQRNRRMNAFTSKLWFGGRSFVAF